MKAAGVPKATIATLRVEHGGHLSLRSAISIAHERGLDTGKAHEFMAKRDAKKAAAPAAQAATADFRSKAAATMKAAGERTAKEGRAAVLAARLRDRAANAFGTKRGDIANARADRILKANPGARGLSEQLRGERRFETKSAVNQTMRLGQVSRSNFNLPATRSERARSAMNRKRAPLGFSSTWVNHTGWRSASPSRAAPCGLEVRVASTHRGALAPSRSRGSP
jgi:hypothetical protein